MERMSDAPTRTEPASLTQVEAEARAALISVRRYDIAVDMTGLLDGPTIECVSTIAFECAEPGASTFVDCAADIRSATLNGRDLDLSIFDAGRLPLPDLAADNVLVVASAQSDTGRSVGILRTVDPSDKLVYVWTSFEPDAARYVWACFDQPDLKAPHGFVVTAPESWTVLSNSAPDQVEPADEGTASVETPARVWTFGDTPPLSTYVVVVNAGPFVELRREVDGYDLGLYARQSLARYLDRDADELFELTRQGLAWFGGQFDQPFPQRRYDQVFVPNMGGAMENWGCVTWTDAVIYRSPPTYAQRQARASVLMHEMAHMWFGDLVTMRWWDDLWLNEAFASWAATWALVGAGTEHTDAWAGFLCALKLEGYRADMSPGTHPIRGDVPDVAQAMANFDAITYSKGQSVLKQLSAYVGDDAFVRGLQAYFRDHAWGNTRLDDLIDAVAAAAGRDLSSWTPAWLDSAGTDTIRLADGALSIVAPDGGVPRPHRFDIVSYVVRDDVLHAVATTPVESTEASVEVDLPEADLHLLNANDLTFAAVRPDATSLATLLSRAGDLPDPLSRALAGGTAWDMMVKGELGAGDVVGVLTAALVTERSPIVVESFLGMALKAAEQWAPADQVAPLLLEVASTASGLTVEPDFRMPALRALAASASTADHFEILREPADHERDLAWRVLARRAELGDYDEDAVTALEKADLDPEAWVRALAVRGAQPDAAAKDEAWSALMVDRTVPMGSSLVQVGNLFWRPTQAELLKPWTDRYLDVLPSLASGGLLAVGGLIRVLFPFAVADQEFHDRALSLAEAPGTHPAIRQNLLTGADTLRRMLAARALSS
ncbi:aminopeptidase N [Nocardioides bigeumensis]|uniref:Aminopeptidase N n=2 Tax=Nocardioides bigeumensis TaxID=433657 RepID=A0ABN2Y1M4_9ACTN